MFEPANLVPTAYEEWLEEIARAFCDAAETISIGPSIGQQIERSDLYHMAPAVCIKFRGIPESKAALEAARTAALTSYIATADELGGGALPPEMAFAFCYVASHFGLDLVSEEFASGLMAYLEDHLGDLEGAIAGRGG